MSTRQRSQPWWGHRPRPEPPTGMPTNGWDVWARGNQPPLVVGATFEMKGTIPNLAPPMDRVHGYRWVCPR